MNGSISGWAIANELAFLKEHGTLSADRVILVLNDGDPTQPMSSPNPDAASRFLADSYLGEKDAKRGFSSLVRVLFGRSKHLWMWDYKAIAQELAAAGEISHYSTR